MTDFARRLRVRFSTLNAVYFGGFAALLAVLHWWPEYLLPVWVLLFVPPSFLLLPGVILGTRAALRRDWRWTAAHVACAIGYLFLFCPFRLSWSHAAAPNFTLITHNIGQGNKLAFSEAFPGESADAILLQDANYREKDKDYARQYPHLRTRGVAQFLLLTPREIVSAAPVGEALWRGNPVAARFVIRVNGREVALYNVHLPTPRNSLRHVISPRVGLEMLWLANAPIDDQPSYRSWLRARVTLAEQLHGVFSRESLPFLVAGDLNTPEHGVVYHQISSGLQDAHATAGRGWGSTFPSDAKKDGVLARIFGAWLRLDYAFAGNGFTPCECRVASDERSQHRAVLARFALVP
jgi:vancomycin resistance protein VanJ